MTRLVKRMGAFFVRELWDVDLAKTGPFKTFIIKFLRLSYVSIRELTQGELTLRAMSLVYTTILSIVPLIAVSFSVLKAFGVHNQVEPMLYNFLAPLGQSGKEITGRIISFVENMKVGVFGSLGLAMLIYTVISLIQKIEEAFNHIWKIKRPRTFAQRFSDYMSVILIGPVLIFSAIGMTASVMNTGIVKRILSIEPLGTFVYYGGTVLPYVFVCAAFTFVYIFIPNTRVKLRSALVGGIFAGVLWETSGWAFASFVVSSTKYTAIYSGFAILILFMIWLYVSWMILLVGAEISFYNQYPQFLRAEKEPLILSNRLKERLAFLIMFLISDNFYHGREHWTIDSLVDRLAMPVESVQDILLMLERRGFITKSGDDLPAYFPARDIGAIKLSDFLRSVRTAEEEICRIEGKVFSKAEIDRLFEGLDEAMDGVFGDMTMKDLVVSVEG
ncbi:MAG TPA: YihY/virulence factor BrkB family protein [Nitrospirae bacterium]|nr:YihY/virulence factor BrkB family protein [Nitrospirota bacterium]